MEIVSNQISNLTSLTTFKFLWSTLMEGTRSQCVRMTETMSRFYCRATSKKPRRSSWLLRLRSIFRSRGFNMLLTAKFKKLLQSKSIFPKNQLKWKSSLIRLQEKLVLYTKEKFLEKWFSMKATGIMLLLYRQWWKPRASKCHIWPKTSLNLT